MTAIREAGERDRGAAAPAAPEMPEGLCASTAGDGWTVQVSASP